MAPPGQWDPCAGEALDPLPAGSPSPLVCCPPWADPMPIALSRQVLVEASIKEIPSYGTAHRRPARLTLVRLERALRERWRRRQVPLRSPGPADRTMRTVRVGGFRPSRITP